MNNKQRHGFSVDLKFNKDPPISLRQQSFKGAYDDLMTKKHVLDNASHPLHDHLAGHLISRSGCMQVPTTATNGYLSSFIPQAVRQHNSMYRRGAVVSDL